MPTPTEQLLSRTVYATDGTTTNWDFSFSGGYLDKAHVKAYTEAPSGLRVDITVLESMLIGPYQLQVSPALATGLTLTIYRDTPKDLPLVDFTDESGFSEIALDTNAKQAVFIAAETVDTVNASAASDALVAAEQAASAAAAAAISEAAASASAVAAAASAVASEASAVDAAAYAASVNPATLVNLGGTQTVTGAKTFSSPIVGNLSGIADTAQLSTNASQLGGVLAANYVQGGADTKLTSLGALTTINGGPLAGFRNFIINGACAVAQRKTYNSNSVPIGADTVPTYGGADRFRTTVIGLSGPAVTGQLYTLSVAGVSNFRRHVIQVTGTAPNLVSLACSQRIEASLARQLSGKTITVSGLAFIDISSENMSVRVRFPTLPDNYASVVEYTVPAVPIIGISTAPTGHQFTANFTIPAAAADLGMEVIFDFTVPASTLVTYGLSQVQLEIGSVATPFELRPYGLELALCQRYYYGLYPANQAQVLSTGGWCRSTSSFAAVTQFPVPMRVKPTAVEQTGVAANYAVSTLLTNTVCTAVPTYQSSTIDHAVTLFTTAATLVAGQAGVGATASTAGNLAYLGWSAEL